MEINDQTNQFVKDLTNKFLADILKTAQEDATAIIQTKLQEFNVASIVEQQIHNTIIPFFSNEVQKKMEEDVNARLAASDIEKNIDKYIVETIVPRLEASSRTQVSAEIVQKLNAIDVSSMAQQKTEFVVKDMIKSMNFPSKSIPGTAINTTGLTIPGNQISNGIIKNLQSTGIQDNASECQVTILDNATVFENKLVAKDLMVAGNVTIHGDISISGLLPPNSAFIKQIVKIVMDGYSSSFDAGTFDQYCARVIEQVGKTGIDAGAVKVKNNPLIVDGTLDGAVVNSNLQSVGALRDLQVVGETLLDQTLYVSHGRLGINTLEPSFTFDLWDQEIQIVAGKKQKDTAIIGTTRNQKLILSSNNKEQLTLNTDGTVSIESLTIGRSTHSSAPRTPTDNRTPGSVVWNENPVVGGPVGWISLGGARWASFGTIG